MLITIIFYQKAIVKKIILQLICCYVVTSKKIPTLFATSNNVQFQATSYQKTVLPFENCALSLVRTYISMDESRRAKTMPLAIERRRGIFLLHPPPLLTPD